MFQFEITNDQRETLYSETKRVTPNKDIYWPDHIFPIARNCSVYANHLNETASWDVNSTVCELGGLLHDVGYTREYDSEESDHIQRGIKFAPELLNMAGIPNEAQDRIIDTIRTHDGNLDKNLYGKLPGENIVVNDVDAMQFFDWPFPTLMKFADRLRPNRSLAKVAAGVIENANSTFQNIHDPFFKELAEPKYNALVSRLKGFT